MKVNGKNYRAVWMEGRNVVVIDQRLLPHRFKLLRLRNHRETAEAMGSGQGREVFYDLMEMEQGHIRLLQAELDCLGKTGLYFDHMEFNVEDKRD